MNRFVTVITVALSKDIPVRTDQMPLQNFIRVSRIASLFLPGVRFIDNVMCLKTKEKLTSALF